MPLVLAPLLIAILPLLAALVLLGLSQTHSSQHGGSGVKGFLELGIKNSFVAQLLGLANKASRWVVSHFAAAQLKQVTAFFSALGFLIHYSYKANADQAKATADAMQRLDAQRKLDEKRLKREAARLDAKLHAEAHHLQAGLNAEAKSLHDYKARTQPILRAHTHAIDVAIPHDIAGLRERNKALEKGLVGVGDAVGELENGAEKTWEWIRTHPLTATTGVFTGAVSIALARLGFGFLRCKSWRNLGKRMTCGMGSWLSSLLDLIAVFALSLLATLDPEALAHVTVRAVDVIEPELQRMLSASPSEAELQKEIDRFLSFLGLG